MTRPRRKAEQQNWMPGINKMIDAMANTALVHAKADGACSAVERLAKLAGPITATTNTHDNEVNYRPAAQQWTVCTP